MSVSGRVRGAGGGKRASRYVGKRVVGEWVGGRGKLSRQVRTSVNG